MQIQKVNTLTPHEYKQLVRLHQVILNESFINVFGNKFLEIVYKSIIPSSNNICFIVQEKSLIIGYAIATFDGSVFNKQVIRDNFFPLLKEIVLTLFRNPLALYYLISWMVVPTQKKLPQELQFIAIDQNYQGQGVGTKLLSKIEQEFSKKGLHVYRVGTKADNLKSNKFYLKNNFRLDYSTKFFGDRFNYYLSPTF